MLIKTLVENMFFDKKIKPQPGLSLYIEANGLKILFDLGSDDLFIENAQKMNVNLQDIDLVVISHGHFDHGGALKAFLAINSKAQVYLHKDAFEDYYHKLLGLKLPIGLDKTLKNHERIILTDSLTEITPDLVLFSGVTGRKYFSPVNSKLLKKTDGKYYADDFSHEQNLIIKENNKTVLFAGCCHNGIINTLEKARELSFEPDVIVSGLHFMKMNLKKYGHLVDNIAQELKNHKALLYTCHCTGLRAFKRMESVLPEKIKYLPCGSAIQL